MVKTKDVLINHFASRNLKEKFSEQLTKIKDILDLKIDAFKSIENNEIKILNENKIKTIRDLGNQSPNEIQIIKKTTQIILLAN